MALVLNADEVMGYLDEVFPQVRGSYAIDRLEDGQGQVRLKVSEDHLRPGGTVSGPAMFGLADCAVYALLLGMVGRKALAVTTNCSIDFMRKPESGRDLIAEVRMLKLGRVLAVADVMMRSEGQEAAVARASLTYSIPPER